MKRKRQHDEKLIVKHERKDQPMIDDDEDSQSKTDQFHVENMTITIENSTDEQMPKKKQKKNRREAQKDFFIPYQPADFKRERG